MDMILQDTCFIVTVPDLDLIKRQPFKISTGEILNVGDEFTLLGEKKKGQSSRGFYAIDMADGWRQRMEGSFFSRYYDTSEEGVDESDPIREFILMSAWHENGRSALEGFKGVHPYAFLAYVKFNETDLLFATKGVSSRVVRTTKLVRYNGSAFFNA